MWAFDIIHRDPIIWAMLLYYVDSGHLRKTCCRWYTHCMEKKGLPLRQAHKNFALSSRAVSRETEPSRSIVCHIILEDARLFQSLRIWNECKSSATQPLHLRVWACACDAYLLLAHQKEKEFSSGAWCHPCTKHGPTILIWSS